MQESNTNAVHYYRTPKRGNNYDNDYSDVKFSDRKDDDDFLKCKNCKTKSWLNVIEPP